MKKLVLVLSALIASTSPRSASADIWGGDLPLLAEIVLNTLMTLQELKRQSSNWNEEMNGIKDRIDRIKTIADVVQPSTWDQWKDPAEAYRRLRTIYHTLPEEYRSAKSDAIEEELSRAMNMLGRMSAETKTTFESGKELERRALGSSPGVAQKLGASGVGTLISMEAQSQVIQSHITSLLTQMLADANEQESRAVVSKGGTFTGVSLSLGATDHRFSAHALFSKGRP